MAVKVGINGFGRIGRNIYRTAIGDPDIDIVAVNDLTDTKTLAHLLKYDSVLGNLDHEITSTENGIKVENDEFRVFSQRDPAAIDAAIAGIGGKVDALFNCAGLPQTAPALDVMKVNYAGTRRVTESVLPLMSEGGAIVSISSNGGMGWSRRIPTTMQLLQIDSYEGAVQWCQDNAETASRCSENEWSSPSPEAT